MLHKIDIVKIVAPQTSVRLERGYELRCTGRFGTLIQNKYEYNVKPTCDPAVVNISLSRHALQSQDSVGGGNG